MVYVIVLDCDSFWLNFIVSDVVIVNCFLNNGGVVSFSIVFLNVLKVWIVYFRVMYNRVVFNDCMVEIGCCGWWFGLMNVYVIELGEFDIYMIVFIIVCFWIFNEGYEFYLLL